ncbi:MAG TPA: hypothetical protein VE967_13330 [Gemmatimonadaceae bacterium]|nr:hypothetical protein [Gemmatimonadaceae bacterium]
MPRRTAVTLVLVLAVTRMPAGAQSVADKIKAAAQAAKDSLAKAGTNALGAQTAKLLDATLAVTPDGTFHGTLAPWTDGTKDVASSRFAGSAVAIPVGSSLRVQLCDATGQRPWTAMLVIPAAGAAGHPVAAEKAYSVPAPGVLINVFAPTGVTGLATSGSLTIGGASETAVGGSGKIKFARAMVPGQRAARAVDFDVVFKARVLAAGQQPPACTPGAVASQPAASAPPAATPPPASPPPAKSDKDQKDQSVASKIQGVVNAAAASALPQGTVLHPKKDGTKMLAEPRDGAPTLATLNEKDNVTYAGREENGFLSVQRGGTAGWVKHSAMARK